MQENNKENGAGGAKGNRPWKHKDHHHRRPHRDNNNQKKDEQTAETTLPAEESVAEALQTEEQSDAVKVEIVGINFREAGKIYYFAPSGHTLKVGQRVIVETARGTEIGTVKVANKMVPETEIVPPLKGINRPATEDDLRHDEENHRLEMDAALICKKKIKTHGLDMSLVAVEYTFDNSKLIFYFTCESRVDFRELVKDLASTFHTRIELRQIGIRDEAKIMGGLGICGRKYCCAGFLSDFVQVSIKMAKEQNFSLNSAKVSGACGRLMCCLRYEHEVYEEAIKRTPSCGSLVSTSDGEGVVIETKPLAEEVKVKIEKGDKEITAFYKIKDIRVLRYGKKPRAADEDEESEN